MNKNIFGQPRLGVHKYRILDTPMVDYIGSILIAMAISYSTNISLVLTTIFVFVISIILHYIFDV